MKGKDIILSDFLSRQENDNSDPGEIIPISFNTYNILEESRNLSMHKESEGKFLIQMHSQAKMSGTTLPEVHRVGKKLDPNMRARKAACLTQKRSNRKAMYRSGQSRIEKKARS